MLFYNFERGAQSTDPVNRLLNINNYLLVPTLRNDFKRND